MIKTRSELFIVFEKLGIAIETYDHPAVFTVEESEKLHQDIPGAHTKNLFVKDKKGRFFLLVVGAHAIINMKSLHKKLECTRLSFGKPDLLMEKLGVTPGSVNAFSIINDVQGEVDIIFDAQLMNATNIACHPMTNTATSVIHRDDLLKFITHTNHDAKIMEISEDIGAENE